MKICCTTSQRIRAIGNGYLRVLTETLTTEQFQTSWFFFSRKGTALPISKPIEDYAPGDLITWDLGGGVPHIGILVDRKSVLTGRYMIVHNIGQGPKMEDVLFNWKITGHYRYFGPSS